MHAVSASRRSRSGGHRACDGAIPRTSGRAVGYPPSGTSGAARDSDRRECARRDLRRGLPARLDSRRRAVVARVADRTDEGLGDSRADADGDGLLLRARPRKGGRAVDSGRHRCPCQPDDLASSGRVDRRRLGARRRACPGCLRWPGEASDRIRPARSQAGAPGRRRRRAGARRLVGAVARVLGRRLGRDPRANVRIRARLLELLRLTRGIPPGRLLARVVSALADAERRGAPRAAPPLARPACGDVGALQMGVLAARSAELAGALGARGHVSRRRSCRRDDSPPRAGDRVLRRRRACLHGSFPGA